MRWTIGDVSERGFEALRLSLLGAIGVFGVDARYAVCVNTAGARRARAATGDVPAEVLRIDADGLAPAWLRGPEDVTVCSPFHPHLPHLGRCGAHFVGLNARHLPWAYFDRPADAWLAEHWARHRDQLERNVTQAGRRGAAAAAEPAEERVVGGGNGR